MSLMGLNRADNVEIRNNGLFPPVLDGEIEDPGEILPEILPFLLVPLLYHDATLVTNLPLLLEDPKLFRPAASH